jgi:hypothetical protein
MARAHLICYVILTNRVEVWPCESGQKGANQRPGSSLGLVTDQPERWQGSTLNAPSEN